MKPFEIFGTRFSGIGLEELVHDVLSVPPSGLQTVVTCNVDHLRLLSLHPEFVAAYDSAWRVTLDSTPIAMYYRLRTGQSAPRATGSDLAGPIFEGLDPSRHSPFFLVSSEETRAGLASRLVAKGFDRPEERIAIPPFGFERDAAVSAALVKSITDNGTTHLFMGVGAPKSEIWVARHAAELGNSYAFCFGSAFDFYVGRVKRAPRLLQVAGFEWLWRVLSEPRRLAGRYAQDGVVLVRLIAADLVSSRK